MDLPAQRPEIDGHPLPPPQARSALLCPGSFGDRAAEYNLRPFVICGNNLKDRSAGLDVRYNWIEHSNRQLDLVHAEDSALVRADPRYRATHVYGNVIVEHPNSGNNDICFYGGDGGLGPRPPS